MRFSKVEHYLENLLVWPPCVEAATLTRVQLSCYLKESQATCVRRSPSSRCTANNHEERLELDLLVGNQGVELLCYRLYLTVGAEANISLDLPALNAGVITLAFKSTSPRFPVLSAPAYLPVLPKEPRIDVMRLFLSMAGELHASDGSAPDSPASSTSTAFHLREGVSVSSFRDRRSQIKLGPFDPQQLKAAWIRHFSPFSADVHFLLYQGSPSYCGNQHMDVLDFLSSNECKDVYEKRLFMLLNFVADNGMVAFLRFLVKSLGYSDVPMAMDCVQGRRSLSSLELHLPPLSGCALGKSDRATTPQSPRHTKRPAPSQAAVTLETCLCQNARWDYPLAPIFTLLALFAMLGSLCFRVEGQVCSWVA